MSSRHYIDARDFVIDLDDRMQRLYQLSNLVQEMAKLDLDVEPFSSWDTSMKELLVEWEHYLQIIDTPNREDIYDQTNTFKLIVRLIQLVPNKVSWVLFGSSLPSEVQVDTKKFFAFFRLLLKENPTKSDILKVSCEQDLERDSLVFASKQFHYWDRHYLLKQIFEFTPTIWNPTFPKSIQWQTKSFSTSKNVSVPFPKSVLIRSDSLDDALKLSEILINKGYIVFANFLEPSTLALPINEHIDCIVNLGLPGCDDFVQHQISPKSELLSNFEMLSEWIIMELNK